MFFKVTRIVFPFLDSPKNFLEKYTIDGFEIMALAREKTGI